MFKKSLLFYLSLLIMLTLSSTISAQICGDVNMDNNVDIVDALIAAQYYVGIIDLDVDQICLADVNGSGQVDIVDALLIAQYFVGLIPVLSDCPDCGNPDVLTRDEAKEKFTLELLDSLLQQYDESRGLVIHQQGTLLPEGSVVKPAESTDNPREIICNNPGWLFFADFDVFAHFAHKVKIIVMDALTGEVVVLDAEWWPLVNDEALFDTLESRTNKNTIIFERIPESVTTQNPPGDIVGGNSLVVRSHDACDAWGIIVCGFDDLPDTFDEDTDDMYTLLTNIGLMDDHIFFVSPHTGHPGVDVTTTIANVQWAIGQVAASADETDKVLFLYSSHGGVDSLSCVPGSPGGGSISASDLDSWLDTITCDELSIIIEACHSGSLIGKYADGTYIPAEDDLTGDGETNRAIFTSASSDTSSYPDRDDPGDPNPGDVGSETIHGYIEAFYTSSADTDFDNEISFGEAYQYAWDNDITRIMGWNTPQKYTTGLNGYDVYNYCYRIAGERDLFVCDGPADVGNNSLDYDSTDIWVTQTPGSTVHEDPVSGMNNYVHVAVHNIGTTSIAGGTLKVYWADTSTATSWPGSFTQIGSDYTFGTLGPGGMDTNTWTWFVDPSIGVGHHFCLVAVADSPDDPFVGAPPGVTYIAPYDNNVGQKNITIVEDHGTGYAKTSFVMANNTEFFDRFDVIGEWIGDPWGEVNILLPDDLMNQVFTGSIRLENVEIMEKTDDMPPRLLIKNAGKAVIGGIELARGEERIISLIMKTNRIRVGQRSEIRFHQEAQGEHLGAMTVSIRQNDPADCDWVARTSVEVFADISRNFRSLAAGDISDIFAKILTEELCGDENRILDNLAGIYPLHTEVLYDLTNIIEPDAMKELENLVNIIDSAIGNKDIIVLLETQGKIAVMLRDLLF